MGGLRENNTRQYDKMIKTLLWYVRTKKTKKQDYYRDIPNLIRTLEAIDDKEILNTQLPELSQWFTKRTVNIGTA